MLLSRTAIDDAAEVLAPEDFYKPAHAHIYEAIVALHAGGEPADPVTVADWLRDRGLLDTVGGPAVLVTIQGGTPATSSAPRYARTIRGHAALRRLIGVAGELAEIGYTRHDDPDRALDAAETLVLGVADAHRASATSGPVAIAPALSGWLDRLEARVEGGVAAGIPTGLHDLDRLVGGLRPGQLITVGGRPGMGKSAFAGTLAVNVARDQRPTLVVSVEMNLEELLDRYMASASRVELTRLRAGTLGERDWAHISLGVGRLADLPLWIDDNPGSTLATIRAGARRAARVAPLELVVVDYLQLLHATTRGENRQVEVAEISAGLKRLARDAQVPVVALAQLSRQVEYRSDKRPQLADLRETGAIENDSDVVVGLYRDEYYNPESPDRGVLEAIVLKQRNGPTGVARFGYLGHTTTVVNLARQEEL